MIVFVALLMTVIIGFLGMAVDVGHYYVVKSELQNAADAGALAGAAALTWRDPVQFALDYAKLNKTDGYRITNVSVDCFDDKTSILCSAYKPTSTVKVTIVRDKDNNGGPVNTYFARIMDFKSFDVTASSAARLNSAGKPHLIKQ
jgi:Flp pilus assembly protein TadG